MKRHVRSILFIGVALLVVGGIAWGVWAKLASDAGPPERPGIGPAPVEVAEVVRGPIEDRRVFSGTLESTAEIRVAAKVGGRVERLAVDLADEVELGQTVAVLDSAEYTAAVAQAEAELAVANANLSEAISALEIARRELQRVKTLQDRGVVSEAQFDTAAAEELAASSQVEVAKAEVQQAQAALEAERIRLGYATVNATWSGGDGLRVVSQQFVEEGDTVAPNTPLLSIVELDPIRAVVYVTERDYARLRPGQRVALRTDAFPGRAFEGEVARVSPVFNEASRQARVELTVPNPEHALKPGMFVRAEAVLDSAPDALTVAEIALTERAGQESVFVVDEAGETVRLVPVELGIRQGDRVQVMARGLEAGDRVVTLGQQLLDEGSEITIPDTSAVAGAGAAPATGPITGAGR